MAKFDDYYAAIDIKEQKETVVIDPIGHSMNKYYSQNKLEAVEHKFAYIDERGRYSEITVENKHVKFIKKGMVNNECMDSRNSTDTFECVATS